MRVLVTPPTQAARESLECLRDWSRAGLLDPFSWWEVSPSGDRQNLEVLRIARGEAEPMLLAEALANSQPDEVALAAFCPVSSNEPVGADFARAVEARVESARQVLAFTQDRPVECSMVAVPGQIGLTVPAELFRAIWAANIYVVPEDRDDPEGVNALAANEERLPAHAAHAISTIAGLWRSADRGEVKMLDRFEGPRMEPAPVQAVRCFTRGLDAGYLADHVAETVFMPTEGWPNPDREKYDRVGNTEDVNAGGARAFMRKHQITLGPTEFEPYEIPPDEKVGLWEALKRLFGLIVDRIRRRPIEFVVAKVHGVHDWMAAKIEEIDGGATGLKVLRAGESTRQSGSKMDLEDALDGKIHRPDGPVGRTWSDLRGMAFCLVDGRGLPDDLDDNFVDRGAKRALVSDPANIAPDPESGYSIISGERLEAVCDPMRLDPSLQPKEKEEAKEQEVDAENIEDDDGSTSAAAETGAEAEKDPNSKSAPVTDSESGSDGAGNISGPDGDSGLKEPADSEKSGETDAGQGDSPETTEGTSEADAKAQTYSGEAKKRWRWSNQESVVDGEADPEIEARQIRAQKSLLWLVGLALATNIKKTREEAKRLRAQIEAMEQPKDKEVEEAEKEELKKRSRKRFRDLIKVVVLTFMGSVVLALAAFVFLPLIGAVLAVLILPAIWLFVTANEARKMLITEKQESRALAQQGVDEMNLKLLAAIRDGDVPRLERRYGEYLDWAEIIGWFVHHPWIGEPLEPVNMDTSVPEGSRPAAFQMAIGQADTDLLAGLGKATRKHVFRPGWLNDLYASNQTDVLEGPAGSAGLIDPDMAEEVSDPASDVSEDPESPRRNFLRGIRRGDYRHVGDNSMTEDLIKRLDELPLDSVATQIVLADEDPEVEPLPPSATWFSAPENLEGLVRRLGPSVVRLKAESDGRKTNGTGVLLPGEELVATAYHVVEGSDSIVATMANKDELSATIESYSAEEDLVILRLEAKANTFGAELGEVESVDQGTPVVSLGFQGSQEAEPTFSWGLVTATQRMVSFDGVGDGVKVLEASYQSAGGHSGAAVFNLDGQVVGIHVGSSPTSKRVTALTHLSHAVPVDRLQSLVSSGGGTGSIPAWAKSAGTSSAAMGAARRRKVTGPSPSDFFGELLKPSNAHAFHADHWRGATVENLVQVQVRNPEVDSAPDSVVSDYCEGNEFLRPLRLMVHRVDIGKPVAAETLASIEPPDEPAPPPPSQSLL